MDRGEGGGGATPVVPIGGAVFGGGLIGGLVDGLDEEGAFRSETDGEELDGEDIVLLLNGLRFCLRIGNGLVVVVVVVVFVFVETPGVEGGAVVLLARNGL